jgi:hypothetical protein
VSLIVSSAEDGTIGLLLKPSSADILEAVQSQIQVWGAVGALINMPFVICKRCMFSTPKLYLCSYKRIRSKPRSKAPLQMYCTLAGWQHMTRWTLPVCDLVCISQHILELFLFSSSSWQREQVVQDTAAEGLPQLSRHKDLEQFLHVDDDTQWMLEEPTVAALRESVVDAQFISATHDMLSAIEGTLEEVDTYKESLRPYLDMLQEVRGISEESVRQQYEAGALDLDGLRQLLHKLADYQLQVHDLQVRHSLLVPARARCVQCQLLLLLQLIDIELHCWYWRMSPAWSYAMHQ